MALSARSLLKRSGVHLSPGSSILIGSASGGVGTAMAQLVHAFDLGLAMVGTCSPSKFDHARSLGVTPVDRNAPDLVDQQPRVKYWGVERAYYQETRDIWLEDFHSIRNKVRTGGLEPVLAKLFRLSEAVEANECLISGTAVIGKTVFLVDEGL